jgi:phage-related minor tail protein
MPDNTSIPVDATNPASWNTIVTQFVEVDANTEPYKKKIDEAKRLGNQFSSGLLDAFDAIAIKGKSLESVFKSLALSLSNSILKAAFAPLQNALAGQVTGVLKGLLPFANGGVLRAGTPVPFASGGIISSPISFPLSGGRTGIAGERGAEAILPLSRGPDGRLGVAMQGGGGPSITINISTPDVESFSRSQTQVAAMIARAASMGQRNL